MEQKLMKEKLNNFSKKLKKKIQTVKITNLIK